MDLLEKILFAFGVIYNAYGKRKFQRIISALVAAALFVVTIAVFANIFIAAGFYGAYLLLINQHIEPLQALAILFSAIFLIILLLVAIIRKQMLKLQAMSGNQIDIAIQAFGNGLISK